MYNWDVYLLFWIVLRNICRKDIYYKNGYEVGKCGVLVFIGGGFIYEYFVEYKVF